MTLQQFRFRIARQFDTSPSSGDERGLIDDWLYEGILDYSRRAKVNLQLTDINLTAGVGDYELSQDVLAFEDAWISQTVTATDRLLEPVDSGEIQRRRQVDISPASGVLMYAIEGENLLMIYPDANSNSDVLHLTYVPKPSKMDSQDDSPSAAGFGRIPDEHHPVLLAYVKAEAADHQRDIKAAAYYRDLYEQGLVRAKLAATRKGGIVTSRVRIGPPNRAYPTRPGIDLG